MTFFSRVAGAYTAFTASAPSEYQGTRWRGASRSLRSLINWVTQIGSGRSDNPATELRTMRSRSRDAFRGRLLARAALTRSKTNIVGTGLMCRVSVDAVALGISQEQADEYSRVLQSSFDMWAEDPHECDWESKLDFYGDTGLALLSAMLSGDCFVLTPDDVREGGVCGLKIQLIEADRCSNPNDRENTQLCHDGVQFDGVGRLQGYWFRSAHPGDTTVTNATWTYYPAFGAETGRRRVLQIWNDVERPEQVRGVPFLAPILEPLQQLSRYGDAELMAAVVSAMFTVFIEREAENLDESGNPTSPLQGSGDLPKLGLGNGAIVDLGPGEKANTANPTRPNVNYDPFFVALVKQIGAALEIPLDELLLHYSSSYSAARAAMLQAWRFYTTRRWHLVQQFCQPIYNLWLDERVAAGAINLPGYADPIRRRAWQRCMWIGPARGAMDEEKEARAAQLRIQIGVSNEEMECAAMSGEPRSAIYAQRLREINQRKADEVWVDPPPYKAPKEPEAPPPSGA